MERSPIKSALLTSVAYDAQTKTLEVQFTRGAVYQYEGVEPEKFQEMMASKSIGSFFLHEIKASFPCKRMDGRDSDATRKEEEDQTRPKEGWPDKEDVA